MADVIRVNYDELTKMKSQCQKVATDLEGIAGSANKWKGMMENGALQGPPGDKFGAALAKFAGQIRRLAELFTEEANDIQGAMDDMSRADTSASGKF